MKNCYTLGALNSVRSCAQLAAIDAKVFEISTILQECTRNRLPKNVPAVDAEHAEKELYRNRTDAADLSLSMAKAELSTQLLGSKQVDMAAVAVEQLYYTQTKAAADIASYTRQRCDTQADDEVRVATVTAHEPD